MTGEGLVGATFAGRHTSSSHLGRRHTPSVRVRRFVLLVAAVLSLTRLAAQSSWTFGHTTLAGFRQATAIAYGNGRFVAILVDATGATTLAWSKDGGIWNAVPGGPNARDIIFLAGAFFATAGVDLLRSGDGESWQFVGRSLGPTVLSQLATDGRGLLISMVDGPTGTLVYSADRVTFRQTAPLPTTPPPGASRQTFSISNLAHVNGRYFVKYTASFSGSPGASLSRDSVASTSDGTSWTPMPALDSAVYLANGNGRMVAGGSFGTVWTSMATTDGINFTPSPGPAVFYNGGRLRFAGGRFFFLGHTVASIDGRFTLLEGFVASTDGVNWAPFAPAPGLNANQSWYGLAYGNGRYIASGWEEAGLGLMRETFATLVTPAAPVIAVPPLDRSAAEGSSTTFSVIVENPGADLTYQWSRDRIALAGATNAALTLPAVESADAGRYTVEVRNSFGTTVSDVGFLTLTPRSGTLAITDQPTNVSVLAGQRAVLGVGAAGTAPFSYQWFRDGQAIPGATKSLLTFESPIPPDTGAYTVTVSNSAGSVTSAQAMLLVSPVSRITNFSVLSQISSGGDSLTLGYVIGGNGTVGAKPLLLRAAGPSLSGFGVTGVLADPRLEIYAGANKSGENDNWGGGPTLAAAFTGVAAFPFAGPTSLDAALVVTLGAGDNSVVVNSANAGGGTVLAEVYDTVPETVFTIAMPRLLNVSVLKPIGTGLTMGFTLGGVAPKFVLIRAVGATLASFGVTNPLADPQLTLFDSSAQKIGENDNWSGTDTLVATSIAVGAFALPPASRDAALLVQLVPGSYTVQVTGVGNTTGTALVEIYEVP